MPFSYLLTTALDRPMRVPNSFCVRPIHIHWALDGAFFGVKAYKAADLGVVVPHAEVQHIKLIVIIFPGVFDGIGNALGLCADFAPRAVGITINHRAAFVRFSASRWLSCAAAACSSASRWLSCAATPVVSPDSSAICGQSSSSAPSIAAAATALSLSTVKTDASSFSDPKQMPFTLNNVVKLRMILIMRFMMSSL